MPHGGNIIRSERATRFYFFETSHPKFKIFKTVIYILFREGIYDNITVL